MQSAHTWRNSATGPAWLSDREVGARYGVSRISVWRWSKENENFPKPRKIGPNTSRWNSAELDQFDQRQIERGACA